MTLRLTKSFGSVGCWARRLKRFGKVAQLVEYEGGGHSLSERTLKQQIDCIRRTLAWFDKYLGKGVKVETNTILNSVIIFSLKEEL